MARAKATNMRVGEAPHGRAAEIRVSMAPGALADPAVPDGNRTAATIEMGLPATLGLP